MQKNWVIIWRFSPLHLWHISLINYSLNNFEKTIVIIWSAEKIDEKNPYSLNERNEILRKEFDEKIILDFLNDEKEHFDWIENLETLLKKYFELDDELYFLWWDLWNDYAIQVIKIHLREFSFKKINFVEKSRQEIPISATKVRSFLKEKNLEEAKKWLSKKTTSLIINKK